MGGSRGTQINFYSNANTMSNPISKAMLDLSMSKKYDDINVTGGSSLDKSAVLKGSADLGGISVTGKMSR